MIRIVKLPHTATVGGASQACRRALDEFASLPPTRAALEGWLEGAYRPALVEGGEHWPTTANLAADLERTILDAQAQLAQMRREARNPGVEFVAEFPTRVDIARIRDAQGNLGFAPVDARGATLAARVLSLFLADYLTRPEQYLTATGT
jgi:hypothetical protein